ncbi:MAG: YqaE/Pmp3 family membrane protein [Bacteroidetes bacterium]|nr:YqaE/Pmp3 family membrane protein [Bacteroidota bacterium]
MENEWNNLTAKEKRAKRKAIKDAVKTAKKNGSDTDLLLLVILAILLPPVAMALYDGISTRFWISLILTLLFFIPGMIYTLIVILGGN